jgi:hypothetical protein
MELFGVRNAGEALASWCQIAIWRSRIPGQWNIWCGTLERHNIIWCELQSGDLLRSKAAGYRGGG